MPAGRRGDRLAESGTHSDRSEDQPERQAEGRDSEEAELGHQDGWFSASV